MRASLAALARAHHGSLIRNVNTIRCCAASNMILSSPRHEKFKRRLRVRP
jgi:hypothetical protein